jgi:predicted dehydrogenase
MYRRHFLAVAAAAGSPAVRAAAGPIPIGILGLQHAHALGKFKLIRESPDWKLTGVAETQADLQAQVRSAGVPLVTRAELLRDPNIQVIAVESDVPDHGADGLAVLQAGKHLHLEKAPAADMKTFERIVRTARERKRVLQTGYMWRYNPAFVRVVEAAREGWLGQIYQVRASMSNLLAAERRAEWARFEGGVMYEFGGHILDPILRILGRPNRVTPILKKAADGLVDNAVATLEWKNAIGIIQAANTQPYSDRHRALEVYGTNGAAIVNPIEAPVLNLDLQKAAGPYKAGRQAVPLPPYKRYEEDLAELAAFVRGDRPQKFPAEDDLLLQEVLLRCCGMMGV